MSCAPCTSRQEGARSQRLAKWFAMVAVIAGGLCRVQGGWRGHLYQVVSRVEGCGGSIGQSLPGSHERESPRSGVVVPFFVFELFSLIFFLPVSWPGQKRALLARWRALCARGMDDAPPSEGGKFFLSIGALPSLSFSKKVPTTSPSYLC